MKRVQRHVSPVNMTWPAYCRSRQESRENRVNRERVESVSTVNFRKYQGELFSEEEGTNVVAYYRNSFIPPPSSVLGWHPHG